MGCLYSEHVQMLHVLKGGGEWMHFTFLSQNVFRRRTCRLPPSPTHTITVPTGLQTWGAGGGEAPYPLPWGGGGQGLFNEAVALPNTHHLYFNFIFTKFISLRIYKCKIRYDWLNN